MGLVMVRPEGRLKALRAVLRDLYPSAKVSARFPCLDTADLLTFEEAALGRVDDVAVLISELIIGEMYLPSDESDDGADGESPLPASWQTMLRESASVLVSFVDTVANVQGFQLYREGELLASETCDEEGGRALWRHEDAPAYIVPGSRDESEEEWFRLVEGFLGRPYREFSAQRTQWERWRLSRVPWIGSNTVTTLVL
jgi:hypothetical protein